MCEYLPQVLALVYERGEEIPLVALYRKELASELLSMREEDTPAVRKPVLYAASCISSSTQLQALIYTSPPLLSCSLVCPTLSPHLSHTLPTTQVTTVDELHHHPDARRLREIYNVGMVQPKHRRMRRCGGGVGRRKLYDNKPWPGT